MANRSVGANATSISKILDGMCVKTIVLTKPILSAPFVLGGVMKIAYDILLYLNFRNMKAPGEK